MDLFGPTRIISLGGKKYSCCRQITFPKDLPRDLQNKDGSEAQTGFFPAEGHFDAQVSMRGSVGQQLLRIGAMVRVLAYLLICLLTPREEDSIILL